MPTPTSARIGLGIGTVMIALGVYIGARSLAGPAAPLTSKPWLDLAFAFFFIMRGGLQVRRWQQSMR